jgi:hypothetical protein
MTTPTSDRLDAYFDHLKAVSPPSLRLWIAEDEGAFIAAAEDALLDAIVKMEKGARLYARDDERKLSFTLVQLMSSASVPAVAEGYNNGHVDVTITHPAERHFVMLGECKRFDGFQYHCDGCYQLLTRYSAGRASRTFCLEFFQVRGMYAKLEGLQRDFDRDQPHKQKGAAAAHRIKGAFLTTHGHDSGSDVEVLHLGCNLYHAEVKALTRDEITTGSPEGPGERVESPQISEDVPVRPVPESCG